jgi:hypothetical protein
LVAVEHLVLGSQITRQIILLVIILSSQVLLPQVVVWVELELGLRNTQEVAAVLAVAVVAQLQIMLEAQELLVKVVQAAQAYKEVITLRVEVGVRVL